MEGAARPSGAVLVLPRQVEEALWAHARREAPLEACGVLAGRDAKGGGARSVTRAFPCRNVARQPRWEYIAEPRDLLRAFLAAEEAGLDVVGFYHSHPLGPPGPSSVDAARATYPGASYVVLWMAPAEGRGSWRWAPPNGFEPEPLLAGPGKD